MNQDDPLESGEEAHRDRRKVAWGQVRNLSLQNVVLGASIITTVSLAWGSLKSDQRNSDTNLTYQTTRIDQQAIRIDQAERDIMSMKLSITETHDAVVRIEADVRAMRGKGAQ